jgi:uncharacterized membrane protein YphA (DoxX/SURF4 family)
MQNLGARIYGLGAIFIGVTGILWANFATGWMPPPANLPGHDALAYIVGALFVLGGILINLPRMTAWGAALLTIVFATGAILLDFTRLAMHLPEFGYWENSAEQFVIISCGAIAFAMSADINPQLSQRIQQVARIVFALSLFIFGAAHFVYFKYSETFVPSHLPPSQAFWVAFCGIAAIAAGLAILSGILDLLAARLLTLMYVIFQVLVHIPFVAGDPANHGKWIENDVNLILIGCAWIVADSLAARKPVPTVSAKAETVHA